MNKPQVLVADPPWPFADKLPGGGRGAAKHYSLLTIKDICSFALPDLADDAALFLWRVASMQAEALEVCRAWGFKPKAEIVWIKLTKDGGGLRMGMGRTVRNAHESCLIATRGRPERLSKSVPSVFTAPLGRHSAKPDEFYALVERLYPGPYHELFARRTRPGWTCEGNEVAA